MHSKRGALLPGATRCSTLWCSECKHSGGPQVERAILGTTYAANDGTAIIELQRRVDWALPDGVAIESGPAWAWVVFDLAEMPQITTLICRGCGTSRDVQTNHLRTALANNPTHLRITNSGGLTL